MRFGRGVALCVAVGMAAIGAGCGSSDDGGSTGSTTASENPGASTNTAAPQGAPADKGVIGFSAPVATGEFFQGVVHGLDEAG
jgi:hypothetical protein